MKAATLWAGVRRWGGGEQVASLISYTAQHSVKSINSPQIARIQIRHNKQ